MNGADGISRVLYMKLPHMQAGSVRQGSPTMMTQLEGL